MAASIQIQALRSERARADVLVWIVTGRDFSESSGLVQLDQEFQGHLFKHLKDAEYRAERGSVVSFPTLGRLRERHLILVGAVEEGQPELRGVALTEAVAVGLRSALTHRPELVSVVIPVPGFSEAVGLGACLGAYKMDRYYFQTPREAATLREVMVYAPKAPSAAEKASFELGKRVGEGVCLARDLVNEPPNELYPEVFADRARKVAKTRGLSAEVFDGAGLLKRKMLLHHAVGRGSKHGPYFIHLSHTPKHSRGSVALIGKGLTFDSGGLCIKPMQGMADMKSDMAGAAAVLGVMDIVSALDLPITVHGIIGAAENMPDGDAYRPADVIQSLSGKGVEIINTDAEGRLVLADALTYAARLKPDFMVDAATLTGATLISLGAPYSAYFTPVESLAAAMSQAAERAGESFWRMPLIEELAQQLKSDITDLKHVGDRYGGAITAALFLREFTLGVPWMHWDIPGATFRERASGIHPKGGTGHGVLSFLELLRLYAASGFEVPKPSAKERGAAKAGASAPSGETIRKGRKRAKAKGSR